MERLSERAIHQSAFVPPTAPYSINELLGFEHPNKVHYITSAVENMQLPLQNGINSRKGELVTAYASIDKRWEGTGPTVLASTTPSHTYFDGFLGETWTNSAARSAELICSTPIARGSDSLLGSTVVGINQRSAHLSSSGSTGGGGGGAGGGSDGVVPGSATTASY
ncbi:hypothetical protein Tcan_05671 [Toxocara canis]|uniref:Uncharacterized protein n=1 Tax=Toxocara canis TaxID=6265 RepID=A0A0B2VEI2_TOXCA|nr:hypothetical protein Tcan_05671 [Toxocara canis]